MSTSRSMAWCVWLLASLFYGYQYILRVMPNIMMSDITQHFHISAVVFGQFSGVYYMGYALVHIPIGILLDRFGPRQVMTSCILLTVLGMVPLVYADNWIYPVMGRALIGIGSSAAILGTFKIIRMSFEEERFTRMLSFSATIGLIGAMYGGEPVRYLCQAWGFKSVIGLFMGMGLILAALTYFIIPSHTSDVDQHIIADVKTVFTNKKVLLFCLCAGLMLGPMEGFADVWGATFLKGVYGFDATTATYLPSMIFMGMCFGGPLLSLLAEKSGQYIACIVMAGACMCAVFSALVMHYLNFQGITLGFFLVGICCAYQIIAIYKASTFVPPRVAGLTTAAANMIIMSFGYGFHTAIGFIVNYYGGTQAPQALILGVSFIPITLALGALGFLMFAMQEYRSKSTYMITE